MRRFLAVFCAALLAFSSVGVGSEFTGSKRALLSGGAPSWVLRGNNVPAGLDFDFANGRYYQNPAKGSGAAGLITVSRASTKYCDDTAGTYASVATNTLCVTNKGALIEEARTNSIRNNSMQGAVAGSPGTLPTNWTFRIGWPQLENNSINSTVASATMATGGATCTNGAQLFTVSGGTGTAATLTGTVVANALQAGALTVTTAGSYTVFPPSPATVTGGGCGTPPTVNLVPTDNSALGFATSPIRTTAAAATRAADVVTATTSPTFGSAYTLFAKGTPNPPTGYPQDQVYLAVDDNTGNNFARIYRGGSTGNRQVIGFAGGVQFWFLAGSASQKPTVLRSRKRVCRRSRKTGREDHRQA
jgi:hypothetical protein